MFKVDFQSVMHSTLPLYSPHVEGCLVSNLRISRSNRDFVCLMQFLTTKFLGMDSRQESPVGSLDHSSVHPDCCLGPTMSTLHNVQNVLVWFAIVCDKMCKISRRFKYRWDSGSGCPNMAGTHSGIDVGPF